MKCPCGAPKCPGGEPVSILFGQNGMRPADVAGEFDVGTGAALRWARAHGEEPAPDRTWKGMTAGDLDPEVMVYRAARGAGGTLLHLTPRCLTRKGKDEPRGRRAGTEWDDTEVCKKCVYLWERD